MSVNWVSFVCVTQKQKAFGLVVLNCSVPVNIKWGGGRGGGSYRTFERSPRVRAHIGPLAHTLNYFVMSCPVLSFLTFFKLW